MDTLEINHNDFSTGREAEADANLMVKFFMREKQSMTKTQEEGRPVFEDREYVEIRVPGKRDALACRPATYDDKQRFPRHYTAFKDRTELPQEGTPLAQWPIMTRSMVEELSFLKIKTVEQLVAMSDNDAGQIRGGLSLKQKAKAFLETSDKTKLINEKEALEQRLAKQDEEMAEMRQMIVDMQRGGKPQAKAAPIPEPAPIDTEAVAPDEEDKTEDGTPTPETAEVQTTSRRRRAKN